MNHLEIEYKTLLDKEEYQSLLSLFADTELVVQTNHYIDLPDQLIRQERHLRQYQEQLVIDGTARLEVKNDTIYYYMNE